MMNSPIITLTTDFGMTDSYVAQMKGVALSLNPNARCIDVTHHVPPQDVVRAARLLTEVVSVFPAGTIHLVVVDPGVGSDRRIVAASLAGQRFVGPDNGILSLAARLWNLDRVVEVTNDRFWRHPVSHTFHGRDIMAPVAAQLSLDVGLEEFGPRLDEGLAECPVPEPRVAHRQVSGEVLWADAFGNLVTNIDSTMLPPVPAEITVEAGGRQIAGVSRYYSEQSEGGLLALVGSSGLLEVAVRCGNAAEVLGIGPGAAVAVTWPETFKE